MPSVLALLWDAYQRMALIPPNPLKLCKHAKSFGLTLQTPFSSHDDHPDDPKAESEATPTLGWAFRIHGAKKDWRKFGESLQCLLPQEPSLLFNLVGTRFCHISIL